MFPRCFSHWLKVVRLHRDLLTQTNEAMETDFTILEKIAELIAEKVIQKIGMDSSDKLLTKKDVMDMLQVSDSTLWRWEHMGILVPKGKIGKNTYYTKKSVDDALTLDFDKRELIK